MSFRLVSKSVTLNDLARRNGLILRYFTELVYDVVVKKTSRSLSHLLVSFLSWFGVGPLCSQIT